MDDEKTIAEEIAEETAETVDTEDIDQAKDRVEDAEDIDSDEIRDEIRDEDDDTRDELGNVLSKLDEVIGRIDGLSRMLIDGGAVIADTSEPSPVEDVYVDLEDLDYTI